jgi:hypothetical protein
VNYFSAFCNQHFLIIRIVNLFKSFLVHIVY